MEATSSSPDPEGVTDISPVVAPATQGTRALDVPDPEGGRTVKIGQPAAVDFGSG